MSADAALIASALAMGAAGVPHCMAMCGAASAAAMGPCGKHHRWAFHLARVASYATAGAAAASGVLLLKKLGDAAPVLRPLWTLLQVAALAWGAWLLLKGRQPAWTWRRPHALSPQLEREGWQRVAGPARAAAAGAAWVAWPCGLLQSALLTASLTQAPLSGALAMGGFALTSSAGLWAAGALWMPALTGREAGSLMSRHMARLSGAMLMGASGWALCAGAWQRVVALCMPM